jgi:hypothetical protein
MRKGYYVNKETDKVIHILKVSNGMIHDISKTCRMGFKNLFFFEEQRNECVKHWSFVGATLPTKYKTHLKTNKKLYEYIQTINETVQLKC